MNKIDIESFRFIWEMIESKLEEISKIPKLYSPSGRGKDFVGYEIDNTGVTYKSETYQCGDTDPESFFVEWHELNNEIEYFKEKYQKQIDAWQAERKETARKEKEAEERSARRKYEELKARFESDNNNANFSITEVDENGFERVQFPFRKIAKQKENTAGSDESKF